MPEVKTLTGNASRYGNFCVPDPESEFLYLLAKKSNKGSICPRQQRRLRQLVEQIGRSKAESLAQEVCLGEMNISIVDACIDESLTELLPQVKRHAWRAALVRNPGVLAANLLREGRRLVRRWLRPQGLLVAVMGLDGTGKSTVVRGLVDSLEPLFRQHRAFHWRPGLFSRRTNSSDTTQPHAQANRAYSVLRHDSYSICSIIGSAIGS